MARSYRTQKERIVAKRKLQRASDGHVIYPRVVERRPAHGDSHPLSARFVRRIFERVPPEYLHGLKRIELRARTGSIGEPFAYYTRTEQVIVLYSLPPVWDVVYLPSSVRATLERFHATIESVETSDTQTSYRVSWRSRAILALWFYATVFAHELGHHKRFKFRHKRGRPGRRADEEEVADLHARRLMQQLFADFRTRRGKVQRGTAQPNEALQQPGA